MENSEIGKYTKSFGLSFAITSVFSALLVILKESSEKGVLALMAAVTGHHWVTHGLINLILFVVLGWALSRTNNGQGMRMGANGLVSCIVGAVIISGILISGFYLLH
jgi:predicted Co/Zn/Cd cation transporter (cation efflux family)